MSFFLSDVDILCKFEFYFINDLSFWQNLLLENIGSLTLIRNKMIL